MVHGASNPDVHEIPRLYGTRTFLCSQEPCHWTI